MNRSITSHLGALALAAMISPCYATVIYDEAVGGDLSSTFSAPTELAIGLGANQIFGRAGPTVNPGGVTDRDYFSITLTPGQLLTSLRVLPGTTGDTVNAPRALLALRSGSMVDPATATAADLLGYYAFGPIDINQDILDNLAISNTNPQGFGPAQGFSTPLGAGTYAFWIQETTSDIDYRIELNVVPEPASLALCGIGLVALMVGRRKRQLPA